MSQPPIVSSSDISSAGQAINHPVPELTPSDVDRVYPLVHSLSTLLRLRGKPASLALLTGGISGGAGQYSPEACLRLARKAGLDARIVRYDKLENISPLTMPCILLLENNRSCVLTTLNVTPSTGNDSSADIILPEEGEHVKTVPFSQLAEEYTGLVVFGALEGRLDARASGEHLLHTKRWFWDVLLYYMPLYKHVIVASIIINIVGVASSLFAMNVYDRVVPNNAVETMWVLASGICLAYLCDFILRNVRGHFVDMAGRNADVVLSSRLVEKILGMRLDAKPESTGALVNNLREFESLREFFSSSSLLTFVDMPFLILFLFLIGYIGGPIVFIPLTAIPLMIGCGLIFQNAAKRSAEQTYRQNMQKNALLVEMVGGLETLKTSMAENRLQFLWEQIVDLAAESSGESKHYSTLSTTIASLITQIVTVGMIVWGVYLISEGRLTMGGLIGCNILVGRAMAPLMQLSGMINRLQQSRMALKSLNTLMELPSEDLKDGEKVDFGALSPAISFENVTFKYPGSDHAVINNVSFSIKPQEKVGIVGRMGSGKSTLGRLLMGLYEPVEGMVKFGGVDVRHMSKASLRSRIGFLPQDVILFYGSVRDNIAFSDPSIHDRLVLRASYVSGVTDFVRDHPAGFGAQVGERGAALSGGQRQSVALARALLQDPDVFVLDEPTSNMDNATENQLKTRLAAIARNKTLIIITHRMSMVDLVDRLIVVDQGRIIADGPKVEVLRLLSAPQQMPKADPRSADPSQPVPQLDPVSRSSVSTGGVA